MIDSTIKSSIDYYLGAYGQTIRFCFNKIDHVVLLRDLIKNLLLVKKTIIDLGIQEEFNCSNNIIIQKSRENFVSYRKRVKELVIFLDQSKLEIFIFFLDKFIYENESFHQIIEVYNHIIELDYIPKNG